MKECSKSKKRVRFNFLEFSEDDNQNRHLQKMEQAKMEQLEGKRKRLKVNYKESSRIKCYMDDEEQEEKPRSKKRQEKVIQEKSDEDLNEEED